MNTKSILALLVGRNSTPAPERGLSQSAAARNTLMLRVEENSRSGLGKQTWRLSRMAVLLVAAAIVPLVVWAQTQKPSVKTVPPVVIKTVPEAGSTGVDPATTEIRVTFSKPMQDGSWSWVGKEFMPLTTGQARYLADGRTCVLPVKLQPGETYVIGINSQSFGNFKDRQGRSAMPYLLTFETKQ